MAGRTVYGNTTGEDGWPFVDEAGCTWIEVPGTSPAVSLEIQTGAPVEIMRAFAADFNAYVETLRDADSAAWTATNSVATSNHLGGTAMDLNWDDHPMGNEYAGYPQDQIDTVRELLTFYTYQGVQMIWWGNDWDSPHDSMHYQMGYNTYGNALTDEFIAQFIRADGFSTFRRDSTVTPPPPPPPAPASSTAQILADATGLSLVDATAILAQVQTGLADSQCTNVNRIAMWLAQIGEESASFTATVEIGDIDGTTYQGRTWIQITGAANYGSFSQWAFSQGLVSSPTYFVDNPAALGDPQWAAVGPAWYWTVARPQINSLCDNGDINGVTEAINGGLNGIDDRTRRWNLALVQGDSLLSLITDTSTTPGDDMALVPQDQWDRVYRELTQLLTSRSPLRHLGEGPLDTMAGFTLNTDGSEHVEICRLLAGYGHPPTIALLNEVAGADPVKYPDRQGDKLIAQAILADISSAPVTPTAATPAQVVYQAAPVTLSTPSTNGQVIGQAYDALEALQSSGVLTGAENAPLQALIGVLQTKQGVSA